jgi:regulator of CtrA degradation
MIDAQVRSMAEARAPTAFFTKTYDEAMGLLVEARDYVAWREPTIRAQLPAIDRVKLCCETMRMTARLTQVMAWLLAQRAIVAGEMSETDMVARQEALARLEICMTDNAADLENLPTDVIDLLDRARRLYVRVARLDDMVRRKVMH